VVVSGTTIQTLGVEFVSSGGVASNTTVSGGLLVVSSAGSAVNAAVLSGASIEYLGGASATGTVISSGGIEIAGSGYTASGLTFSNSTLEIASGGFGVSNTFVSGGTQQVDFGGSASGTVVSGGGFDRNGGVLIFSGGTASSTILNDSGTQIDARQVERIEGDAYDLVCRRVRVVERLSDGLGPLALLDFDTAKTCWTPVIKLWHLHGAGLVGGRGQDGASIEAVVDSDITGQGVVDALLRFDSNHRPPAGHCARPFQGEYADIGAAINRHDSVP
jgi:autotransporter passenger strand-loop-strand repeat protein